MLLGIQIFTVRGESIYKEKNKYKLKDGKESDAVVLNLNWMDFPGSAVYKNPPASCRGHWFDPWSGKIPKQGATKPVDHNYWAWMQQLLKPLYLEPVP